MSLFNYECDEVKRMIDEVSPNYPQLTTYEKEWLFFHKYHYIPGIPVELECQNVIVNPTGTVQNAIPYPYKRAILKGQTLKNHINTNDFISPSPLLYTNDISVEKNTIYTCFAIINSTDKISDTSTNNLVFRVKANDNNGKDFIHHTIKPTDLTTVIHVNTKIEITNEEKLHFRIYNSHPKNMKIMLIKGDYTNQNIPYFEGIQSVKMPVLTTQGKNLWDNKVFEECPIATINNDGSITLNGTLQGNWLFNYTIDKGTYCASAIGNDNTYVHLFWKGFDTAFQQNYPVAISEKVTRQGYIARGTYDNVNIKLQLEFGTQVTSYEPHKSNILTVNEGVTLRSNGSVYDELDLLTGKLTQRIDENGEVLSQEIVKTVDLTTLIKPYEGTNNYHLTANIPCEAILEVPVVSTGEQTISEINNY